MERVGTSWLSGNLPFSPSASFSLPGRQPGAGDSSKADELRVVICTKNQGVRYGRSGPGGLDSALVSLHRSALVWGRGRGPC